MELIAGFTGLIIFSAFLAVFFTKHDAELVFGVAFLLLLLIGALPVEKAFTGLSNPGVITLVCLFIIAGALRQTGGVSAILSKLLKSNGKPSNLELRLLPPVTVLSAFFNNTPIVAALTPNIVDWCKRYGLSPSKILLPISYAAILGGTCTVIGTSTNLILKGLLESEFPETTLGFFEIAKVGLPITVLGLLYLVLFSKKILPNREIADIGFDNAREYTFEMIVSEGSELIGRTVEEAGLRGLNSVYLIELIQRETKIGHVRPGHVLQSGDRLIFSGSVSSITDLATFDGLKHAEDQIYKLEETINTRILEVIVTSSNSIVGQVIKESNFRKKHQSVIIAVIRNGARIDKKTGDIKVQAGDLLLLHAAKGFVELHKYSRDFLILQGDITPTQQRESKSIFAWISLLIVVLLAAFNVVHIVVAGFMGVILCLLTACLTTSEALRSIDFKVLALVVFAFGFGEAIKFSGLSSNLSDSILQLHVYGPFALLVGIYLLTLVLTEFVTNNAAAVIVFSLVTAVVGELQLNIMPFVIAIMIAASASFITPLGYQTNLIVYSAGNYRFVDFLKLGMPLSLLVMVTSLILIPIIWSF